MLYDNLLSGKQFYIEYGSNLTTNLTKETEKEGRVLMESTNESFKVNHIYSEGNSSFLNILQSK